VFVKRPEISIEKWADQETSSTSPFRIPSSDDPGHKVPLTIPSSSLEYGASSASFADCVGKDRESPDSGSYKMEEGR
jgi:hypothetical protein